MLVRDVMRTEIVSVPAGANWRQVAQLLLTHHLSGAPVITPEGRVIGVVSEKDVFRAIYPTYKEWYEGPHGFTDFLALEDAAREAPDKPVEQFMSTRLVSVEPATPVLQVGALMVATGIHRVPVIERGKLVGMVGRRDIFRAILRVHFALEESNGTAPAAEPARERSG